MKLPASWIVPFPILIGMSGCASNVMLPDSASKVQFASGKEGKVGWASFREEAIFHDISKRQALDAAKAGLGDAGFAVSRADPSEGVVMGEHGVTMHDWNIVAGVYLKEQGHDVLVVVLAEGSKDIGIAGDQTGGAWTGRILKGMRDYVRQDVQVIGSHP